MRSFFSLLILLFLSISACAQQLVTVAGKVLDSDTGEPIRFVSVGLEGTAIANISNSEGVFSLKIPADFASDGIVSLSHLGYLQTNIPVRQFEGYTVDKPLNINMKMVALTIDASIIRASEAESLVKTAYYKVKDNYSNEHQAMTAFYRELIKKGNTKYLSLNEAVLDIDKAPYNGYQADRAGIYKGRGTINYDSSDTLLIKYQGGVTTSLAIDLVRNPFPGVVEASMFDFYDFEMGESVVQNDKLFYCVTFNQKPSVNEALFRGKLYIESESFAIGRAEFQVNVEDYPEVVNHFIIKRPPKTEFSVEEVSYIVNYKEQDGVWYYDYCHIKLQFTAKKKYSLFKQHFSTVSEMAITNHHPGQLDLPAESRIKFRDQLSERLQDFTDENFWESYNVIEPDANIDAIVRKIVRQLNRRNESR